jgi:glycosyltransferase involved in cell wall biosynthesis
MSAHILIIADGRSPTAQSWIANIQALGYSVSLISTFPCTQPAGVCHFYILPVAFSRLSGEPHSGNQPGSAGLSRSLIRRYAPSMQSLRYVLGPLTIPRFAWVYRRLIRELQPDLVHALRIPFEGMLGAYTPRGIPFLAATWGNDLTLHASGSLLMRVFTKRCLARADGFLADTQRDVRLAKTWGLQGEAPTLVVPGTGGLDVEVILAAQAFNPASYTLPANFDWVINPRGLRPGSIHQDVFFAAIPEVLTKKPDTHFICPGLAGSSQAEAWVSKYQIRQNTHLLTKLTQPELWSLMKASQLYVSPSSHDGTPNSLLEAMACGCFPVVGAIESLREWIIDGENGLLVDPHDPKALAAAICRALEAKELRQRAADQNLALVKKQADQKATRPRIAAFYQQFLH